MTVGHPCEASIHELVENDGKLLPLQWYDPLIRYNSFGNDDDGDDDDDDENGQWQLQLVERSGRMNDAKRNEIRFVSL